ncbi:MAG: T9SS type A sorting domain-containing protein [Candidatus Edwardsbacteria bacterium]
MKKIILILCGLALFASPVLAVTVTTTDIDWATYNTEARKLCRFPGTSNLALVYTDGYEGNYNCYYVASNDLGFNWSGNELIAKGQYPSLSVHPGLGFQWYLYSPCYYKESPYKYYLCGAYGFKKGSDPLPPLNYWQGYLVDSVSAGLERVVYMSPPAIAISGDPDFGTEYLHLVYEKRWGYPKLPLPVPGGWLWIVHQQLVYIKTNGFYEVVEGPEVIYEVEWSTIELLVHPLSPSITLDFNDVPHVAWSLRDTVWYSSREGGVWGNLKNISEDTGPGAGSACIDFYGDQVWVTWEARWGTETGPYEIWYRSKNLTVVPLTWGPYDRISRTPTQDSRWPQIRGGQFIEWSENLSGTNWEIMLNGTNISNNTTQSRYGQTEFWQDADGAHLAIAWTDQVEPPYADGAYQILFWTSTFSAAKYYSVDVGLTEASPYTLYRDGYITYPSGISIDWASNELVYRLPYLFPDYDYTLVVVGYHESKGKWNAQVKLDGREARVLKVESGVPDTVRMDIPLPYYQDDHQVELRVRRLTGDFAGVCDVSLYQFERGSKGGGGAQTAIAKSQIPISNFQLFQNIPNPVSQTTDIRYQIPVDSRVSLKIYNITGQLVRTLVDEPKSAGIYKVTWDGRDEKENAISNGIYFYHLTAGDKTEVKKMILIR